MCSAKAHTRLLILSYLLRNPKAQDTVEGITGWWLLEEEVIRRLTTVAQVVQELVAANLVVKKTYRDGQEHYRINAKKLLSIQREVIRLEKSCSGRSPATKREEVRGN